MNLDSLAKMRLDRRLLRRRGWIAAKELEQSLAELPDAAQKATTLGEADDSEKVASNAGAPGDPPPVA
jgi:hypothetical protein